MHAPTFHACPLLVVPAALACCSAGAAQGATWQLCEPAAPVAIAYDAGGQVENSRSVCQGRNVHHPAAPHAVKAAAGDTPS